MNIMGETQAAPGFGSVLSPVVLVGQSLCRQCMEVQEPFYEGSGVLLDKSFALAGVDKKKLFVTNVVHCHPPKNRESLQLWIRRCSPYLHEELEIVQPKVVIGLGEDAAQALTAHYRKSRSPITPALVFAKHPSWILRQHDHALEKEYVDDLARMLAWATS
jgi:DNA polymerase